MLVSYTGGSVGAATSGDPQHLAARFLRQADPVIPGLAATWDGRTATLDHWASNP